MCFGISFACLNATSDRNLKNFPQENLWRILYFRNLKFNITLRDFELSHLVFLPKIDQPK